MIKLPFEDICRSDNLDDLQSRWAWHGFCMALPRGSLVMPLFRNSIFRQFSIHINNVSWFALYHVMKQL